MKSVIIKDCNGNILIKIIHRKNGAYELIKMGGDSMAKLDIEVRATNGCRVIFDNRILG